MTQPTPTPQLPLMVSINGAASDDPRLTPGLFALPVGSVTATPELTGAEDTLLSGALIELTPATQVRAITIRINIPTDRPLPIELGRRWAGVEVGEDVTITETYTNRYGRTSYLHARVRSNTIAVSLQASLTTAYYSGALEARLLIEDKNE